MLEQIDKKYTYGQFLFYHDIGPVGKKTRKYEVVHREKGFLLGYIKWFAHWRRYVFYPLNCILDSTCMREISDFCDEKTKEIKSTWKSLEHVYRHKRKAVDARNRTADLILV